VTRLARVVLPLLVLSLVAAVAVPAAASRPAEVIVLPGATSAEGASATIAGVSVPQVDGIVLQGRRLWAVQNTNQVTRIRLGRHLQSGMVDKVITSPLFQTPATAARFGSRLAVVNAKFDTGIPPTADQYEVVVIKAYRNRSLLPAPGRGEWAVVGPRNCGYPRSTTVPSGQEASQFNSHIGRDRAAGP
jgi:hypothetical protein